MKIEEVKRLSTIDRFLYWIRERYQIYLKRKVGKEKPWTNDEILQTYKFCNVHRKNDRVSQWLINHWYKPYKNHRHILLACTLARQLNNIESLGAVGFPDQWLPESVLTILKKRHESGLKNYAGAYVIASIANQSGIHELKYLQTVEIVCQPIYDSQLRINTSNIESTWNSLLEFKGFGSFICGQVVADLVWGLDGDWSDIDSFAPVGPGSTRGMNRLKQRDKNKSLSQLKFLTELRDLFEFVSKRKSIPKMNAMDLQNCLCEFDKYSRTLEGSGKPKQKYPGV